MWTQELCRISPSCFLAECRKKRLNPGNFVLVYFVLFLIVKFNAKSPLKTIRVIQGHIYFGVSVKATRAK